MGLKINFVSSKELLKLSEQYLIDANNLRNYGCEGGSVAEDLRYISNGCLLEKGYTYDGVQGPTKRIMVLNTLLCGGILVEL